MGQSADSSRPSRSNGADGAAYVLGCGVWGAGWWWLWCDLLGVSHCVRMVVFNV